MSTRSYVGIIKDGKVRYGYHHCDSHLESLGVELFETIKTEADAVMRFSETNADPINVLAELDMGRTESRESFFAIPSHDCFIEFCYGFDVNDNQWYVSSHHFTDVTKTYKLVDVVKDDKEMDCYLDMYYEEYRDGLLKKIREKIRGGD